MSPYLRTAIEIVAGLCIAIVLAIVTFLSGNDWLVRLGASALTLAVSIVVGYRAGMRRYA